MSDQALAFCRLGNVMQTLGQFREAVAAYDKSIALEPGYLAALNNRGVALLALHQPLEAIASYESALALDPDFTEAIYNRGDALRELRRFAEALRDYERAIALRPTHVEAFNNRGNALQELNRPLDALTSYDQALALRPAYVEALENKAILLGEFGVLDAARQALQSVIAVAPGRARAHYHLARLKRMTRSDPQLKILEGLAGNLGALSTKDAIDVGFAVAKAYDDIGDYERAFAAYVKANASKRAGIAYDEAQALAHFGRDRQSLFAKRDPRASRNGRRFVGADLHFRHAEVGIDAHRADFGAPSRGDAARRSRRLPTGALLRTQR